MHRLLFIDDGLHPSDQTICSPIKLNDKSNPAISDGQSF